MISANQMRSGAGLSEDDIKRMFVPFLRDFYRARYEPLPNSEHTSLDNVGEGGIVADGIMSFRKKDGSPFVCTYEATSRDKAEEVKYSLNLRYFLWDCAAFGMVCSALLYLFTYATQLPWLVSLRGIGNVGLLLGTGMIGFFTWYFLCSKWRKYRYIYAIEQFRRYAADEQWIALGEDVFPAPTDPYLTELRNQSVYRGFGLAIVAANGGVRVLNAPSRLGVYGEGRKMIHWVTRAQWYQVMSEGLGQATCIWTHPPDAWTVVWNKISRPIHYLLIEPLKKNVWSLFSRPFGQTASAYHRFMTGHQTQKFVFTIALCIGSFLLYKVLNIKEETLADLKALKAWKAGKNPEDEYGIVVDGGAIPYNGEAPGVPKQYPLPVEKEEAVPEINLSGDDEEEAEDAAPATTPPPVRRDPAPQKNTGAPAAIVPKSSRGATTLAEACQLLKGHSGWIVQDNVFSARTNAQERAQRLYNAKLTAHWSALACAGSNKSGYLVWVGALSATEADAQQQKKVFEQKMRAAGVPVSRLLVRKIP
jgi:hypothetical protein